jgi:hypothetical protein
MKTIKIGQWYEFPQSIMRPEDTRCEIREIYKESGKWMVAFSHNVIGAFPLNDFKRFIINGTVKFLGIPQQYKGEDSRTYDRWVK